ncbi:MAG: peptidylprolyl isomerase [Gemmatimonadetes bacterium]|nr:peptidylprolyl isomerase [Gemmatimonadota bacterium]
MWVKSGSRMFAAASFSALVLTLATCMPGSTIWAPSPEEMNARAPDSFVVAMETSEGSVEMMMYREWSPLAVDRVYYLMANDFYAGARFYRVVPGFVAQWGLTGKPVLDSIWKEMGIDDEPVMDSNARGTVAFARGGPRTRSFQLFINLADNSRLDAYDSGGVVGFPPIGRIHTGMEVVDGLYGAYGQPEDIQDSISTVGSAYLRRTYPQLDSILNTRVVRSWPPR